MKLKNLIIPFIFLLFSIVVSAAPVIELVNPGNASSGILHNYVLTTGDINVICNATPSVATYNITNISLYMNTPYDSGTFKVNRTNQTTLLVKATAGAEYSINWNFTVGDHTTYNWNCYACENNASNNYPIGCAFADTNRTFIVENPVVVTINSPSSGIWNTSSTRMLGVNFTAKSAGSPSNNFYCRMWTNATNNGTFQESPLGQTVINNTPYFFYHYFPYENTNILWNIKCRERFDENVQAFGSTNKSINFDSIDPVGVITPADGTYKKTITISDLTVNVTDTNIDLCILYANFTGTWAENNTNATISSGIVGTFPSVEVANGNGTYYWNVWCNDTAGHSVWISPTANYTFIVDTRNSSLYSLKNYTSDLYCDKINVTIVTDNATNATLMFGDVQASFSNKSYYAGYSKSKTLWLDFGNDVEKRYYYNITYCTQGGTCSASGNYNFVTPLKICTSGEENNWSVYAILEATTTLGLVSNNTKADFVYWWNQTGQAWKYVTYGSAANSLSPVKYGDAVFLFDAVNTSWFRDTVSSGNYTFLLRSGYNFIGAGIDYTFYNLTVTSINASFTMFGAYNNSNHDWYLHRRSTSWNNLTVIPRGDVFFTWSDLNLTWNTTYTGGMNDG